MTINHYNKSLNVVDSNTSHTIIREAIKDDLKAIKYLLDNASLPSVDIEDHILNFLVLVKDGVIVGTIGAELYRETALLRSLAVMKEHRHKGYGKRLCKELLLKAVNMNINFVYLLTETADGFFCKEGFHRISRKNLPLSIEQSYEFSNLCPYSAVCMVKILLPRLKK
jgi:amino-acid N-acetyltransferase